MNIRNHGGTILRWNKDRRQSQSLRYVMEGRKYMLVKSSPGTWGKYHEVVLYILVEEFKHESVDRCRSVYA